MADARNREAPASRIESLGSPPNCWATGNWEAKPGELQNERGTAIQDVTVFELLAWAKGRVERARLAQYAHDGLHERDPGMLDWAEVIERSLAGARTPP